MSDEPPPVEPARAGRPSIPQRLREMGAEEHWIHHAASLDTGERLSAEFDRPLSLAARAERLAHFFPRPPTPFGGPSYLLTPRVPYQAEPEAMLIAGWLASFDTEQNTITWEFLADQTNLDVSGLFASFATSPEGSSVVSISLSGASYRDQEGQIRVTIGNTAGSVTVPLSGAASQTIDIVFLPLLAYPIEVWVDFTPGIYIVAFQSIFCGPVLPEADPGLA